MIKRIIISFFSFFFCFLAYGADPTEMFWIKAQMIKGNYGGAIDSLKIIDNSKNRNNYEIKSLLGECYWQLKDYKSALTNYAEADKLKPGYASLEIAKYYALNNDTANVFSYLQRHLESSYKKSFKEIYLDPAFKQFENAKKWNQFWENKWYNSKEILTGEVEYYIKYNNFEEALSHLHSEVKKKSITHYLHYLEAKAYIGYMNYGEAMQSINKAISTRKRVPEYYELRASLYIRQEKLNKALEDISTALDLNPYWFDGYITKAKLEQQVESYGNAVQTIQFYLKYFPENIEAHYLNGEINFDKGSYLKALEIFNFCLKNDSTKAKYYSARGKTYLNTKMYVYAAKDFSMSLDINPIGETYYNRAIARKQNGDKELVCSDLKKAYMLGYKKAYTLILDWCE